MATNGRVAADIARLETRDEFHSARIAELKSELGAVRDALAIVQTDVAGIRQDLTKVLSVVSVPPPKASAIVAVTDKLLEKPKVIALWIFIAVVSLRIDPAFLVPMLAPIAKLFGG